jgi:leucyl/phenylalanyl-tRNA--protein transferase
MNVVPVEPPPSNWLFPHPSRFGPSDIVALGADLEPGTLLQAYRSGIFPMPLPEALVEPSTPRPLPLAWWSPDPRAVLPIGSLRVSHSLRRSLRRFQVRFDTAFDAVIEACADSRRPHGWIDDQVIAAYRRLHALGWAHSVEAWSVEDGSLAGGLYGVAIGGLFAGESMFHRRTDASKVALAALTDRLRAYGFVLHDVQWLTPHLETLGARAIPREEYLSLLGRAVAIEPHPLSGEAHPPRSPGLGQCARTGQS